MELDGLRIFVRVAQLKSFTRAAAQLGLNKARVSIRLSELENELGSQLLLRTTRQVQLTEEGEQFFQRAERLLAEAEDLQSMFAQSPSALRGRVRLDLPISMARDLIIPRLPELIAAHPLIELQLSATDQRVDVLRDGFDCVLRVGNLVDSGLVARKLGALAMANCASPSYLQRMGTPRTIAELDKHLLVAYAPDLNATGCGFEYRDGTRYRVHPMRAAITVNNADAYQAACIAGLGIVQAPMLGCRKAIAEGRSVEILRDFPSEPMPVSLVHGPSRAVPKRVRAVMSWLGSVLAPHLLQA